MKRRSFLSLLPPAFALAISRAKSEAHLINDGAMFLNVTKYDTRFDRLDEWDPYGNTTIKGTPDEGCSFGIEVMLGTEKRGWVGVTIDDRATLEQTAYALETLAEKLRNRDIKEDDGSPRVGAEIDLRGWVGGSRGKYPSGYFKKKT